MHKRRMLNPKYAVISKPTWYTLIAQYDNGQLKDTFIQTHLTSVLSVMRNGNAIEWKITRDTDGVVIAQSKSHLAAPV